MGTELQIRNGCADSVELEVHAELQIMNKRADSVGSATSHDDGYRARERERRAAPKSRIVKNDNRSEGYQRANQDRFQHNCLILTKLRFDCDTNPTVLLGQLFDPSCLDHVPLNK